MRAAVARIATALDDAALLELVEHRDDGARIDAERTAESLLARRAGLVEHAHDRVMARVQAERLEPAAEPARAGAGGGAEQEAAVVVERRMAWTHRERPRYPLAATLIGVAIENQATGERIAFRDGGADLLVMDVIWTRPGHRAPAHVHPRIEERWYVVEGAAAFAIGDGEQVARVGETVVAAAGVPHLAWNPTDEPVRLRIEMRPALRWREFVERLFAGDDPAALVREFPREIAPAPRDFCAG